MEQCLPVIIPGKYVGASLLEDNIFLSLLFLEGLSKEPKYRSFSSVILSVYVNTKLNELHEPFYFRHLWCQVVKRRFSHGISLSRIRACIEERFHEPHLLV